MGKVISIIVWSIIVDGSPLKTGVMALGSICCMPKSLQIGSCDFIILEFFLNKSLNKDVILVALNVKDLI